MTLPRMPARPARPALLARRASALLLLPVLSLLGGCQAVLLSPSGDVALQQRNLMLISTALMLMIVVPVMALIVYVAWRYRASNHVAEADYAPEWNHSLPLEVAIWTAPLLIIIAIGAITWLSTHLLDPFRPLGRIDSNRHIPQLAEPLKVEVVALDWKWLFIYPELGIASLNEMAAPIDRPLSFKITASNVMNSFYVPALAGQIYAMPAMQTQLHAVINEAGSYKGFSANYSGAGFARMTFTFHGLEDGDFDKWVAKVKSEGTPLDRAAYAVIEKPSEADPVRYFSSVEGGLFQAIVNMCTAPGQMCVNEMMRIDAKGGAGVHSRENRERLRYDRVREIPGHGAGHGTPPAPGANGGHQGHGGPAPAKAGT